MTSRASKIVVAAVLASSIPAAPLACEREREYGQPGGDARPPAYYAPPPEYPAPPAPTRWREDAWRERWREREIARVSARLESLETRRAEARARFGWNPQLMLRFERWYAARRAEFEQRLYGLQYVAWR